MKWHDLEQKLPAHHSLRPDHDGRGAKVFFKSQYIGAIEYGEGAWHAFAPKQPLRAFNEIEEAVSHLRVAKILNKQKPQGGGK